PGPRAPKLHRAVVVQFRKEFLGEALFDLEEMRPIARLLKRSECGLAFSNTKTGKAVAPRIAKFPSLSPSRRVIELLSALLDLSAEAHPEVLSTSLIPPICRVEDQQRIDAVCAYLNRHFDHEIDYAELSRIIHMDHASLCRFFKRATGRTMTAYVNQLRVGAAAHLLTDTDISILEVGFRVGFGNYSNFNRQFKRIKGYVPRAVRQHFHPDAPEPQSPVHSAKRKSTRPSTPAKTRAKSKA
ncbi:MAG: helix-turn-helix domain-containing protein, partial [Acidobacteriaceae bacterium]